APDLPHQDQLTHEVVSDLLQRIETACAKLRIATLSGTVVGTLNDTSINAFNASFFGAASLIVIHTHTIVFVWLLVKCVLPAIATTTPGSETTLNLGMQPMPEQL